MLGILISGLMGLGTLWFVYRLGYSDGRRSMSNLVDMMNRDRR